MEALTSMRIWFAMMAAMLWAGIYITGFTNASWLLYVPATGLMIALAMGFCPVQRMIAKMLGEGQRK
ncbi:hypothetical protein FO440_10130 [Mucilaginibacter corticis]|uniref:DUF2892 domain-containing protein n=1 Tax=Mucilaginibacter corticis TaxID=2597670 RepID=A0A556MX56_9SPHI|nr:hypothetical protein [Mucilaginibacter corticis]TSJ44510.1 hypothetical protein FO440_10130 [Mucilaginibacter corticis]